MVTWQHHQRSFVWGGIKNLQTLFGLSCEGLKLFDPLSESKVFGAFVLVAQNHMQLVAQALRHVKRNEVEIRRGGESLTPTDGPAATDATGRCPSTNQPAG